MENVVKFTDQFIEKVNVSEGLLSLKTSSANGALFRINAIKHLKENAITLNWLVGLVQEGATIQDANVQTFVEGIKSNVVENFNAVTIGFLYESITESEDVVHQNVANAINSVISEGESKIGASVLGGELSKFKAYFGDLKLIESRVVNENIQNKNMVETNQLSIYSPMSYVLESNGSEIVRVGNHIFAIGESIIPTKLPSQKFFQLSEAAKNIQYNIEESRGEVSTALGTLVVENGEIKRDVDGTLTVVETEKLINEFSSGVELRKFEKSEITKLDNAIAVAENFESYRVLENFKVIENKATKDVALIAEHNGVVYCGILESQRTFKRFNTVASISEAVSFVKNTIGVDASKVYESALEDEKTADDEKKKALDECDDEIKTLEAKRTKVQEGLKTTTEGGEAHTKYLDLDIKIGEALVGLTKKRQSIVEGADEKHYITIKDPKELNSKKVRDEITKLAKDGVRSKNINLRGEFVDGSGQIVKDFRVLKNKVFFEISKTNESSDDYVWYISDDNEDVVKTYKTFDKEKITKDFDSLASKLEDGEELFFMKVDNNKKTVGDDYLFTVVNQNGSLKQVITRGNKEFYKKYTIGNLSEGADKDTKGDKEAYQEFFKKTLKEFGVNEPDELEGEEKKKFFDAIDKGWKADDEVAEGSDESDEDEDESIDEKKFYVKADGDLKYISDGKVVRTLDMKGGKEVATISIDKFNEIDSPSVVNAKNFDDVINQFLVENDEEESDEDDDKDVDEAKELNFKKGDTVKYKDAKLTAKVISVKDTSMGKEFGVEWEDGKKGTVSQGDDIVLVEGKEPDSKFEVGDKVFYLPSITGMNKKKPLEIERKKWYKEDSIFGEKTEYMWWYSFKGIALSAREKELTANVKDVKESVDDAFETLTK